MNERPIRIAIDARPLGGPPCGFTIYLESVLHCLRRANFEPVLLTNKPILPQYEAAAGLPTAEFGHARQVKWEQIDLPRYLAASSHDIYFTAANRGIPIRKTSATRYVLGLLDVIPYLFFREYHLRRWRVFLRHPAALAEILAQLVAVARADAILTISKQSARDIRRIFRRSEVTACLIRLREVEESAPMPPEPQFAYVGGVDVRKKVDVLLRAFAGFAARNPQYRLVLIGSNYRAVEPLIAELGLGHRVTITGYVDHDTKFDILRRSQAMVYPSLYEGYGMAIAEGFQADIPVIAGCGGSQAEIGGEAIRQIDPLSADDIETAMEEMLAADARAEWIDRGRRQLARLTDPAIEEGLIAYFAKQGRLARPG